MTFTSTMSKASRPSHSPDPLALDDDDMEVDSPSHPSPRSKAGPSKPSRPITPRKRPLNGVNTPPNASPKKKAVSAVKPSNGVLDNSKKTPLSRASPASNRVTPTPTPKSKGVDSATKVGPDPAAIGEIITPIKRGPGRPPGAKNKPKIPVDPNVTPIKRGPGRPPGSKNKPKPEGWVSLGSSAKKVLPTPSPAKRPRIESPTKSAPKLKEREKERPIEKIKDKVEKVKEKPKEKPQGTVEKTKERAVSKETTKELEEFTFDPADLMDEDDLDGMEKDEEGWYYTPATVTRDTFLANEALRRQKMARGFVYEGDANAPKLTRSGRIIGEADKPTDDEREESEDVYGGDLDTAEVEGQNEQEMFRAERVESAPVIEDPQAVEPLPTGARKDMLEILSTLSGADAGLHPKPFAEEEKVEALNGLVNLLKGTVERGEGNSALLVGARGVGKTRTVSRALDLLPSEPKTAPIIVRLSGHAQTNDRLAIREMGRQIAEAEGAKPVAEEEDEEELEGAEYAPTTLPSHLLALLTAPSPRAIIIIMEEFDMFTEHARQALLYCLLDVVQSVKTGPVETTGRGVAVIGVTSRVDTLLLLEKRVKSRFSHRMWRVQSPLSPEGMGWKETIRRALIPWDYISEELNGSADVADETIFWREDWTFAVDTLLGHEKLTKSLNRLCGLTTDVRILYRPFIIPIAQVLSGTLDFLSVPQSTSQILLQTEQSLHSLSLPLQKLRGLPHPSSGILIISKHLHYAGREEFTFAMVQEEYLRFARTKLVGSGRTRWPIGVLRAGFEQCLRVGVLVPSGPGANSISGGAGGAKGIFAKVRCTLSPHEIVAWFKGEGGNQGLGPELVSWGRMMGGHV